ncbi:MAG: amidohydrolase family protein [Acidobacteriota bacterium]
MRNLLRLLLLALVLLLPVDGDALPPTAMAPGPQQDGDKDGGVGSPDSNEKEEKSLPADGAEEEDEEWSVENPPLPTYSESFEISEGTWMSLDVSPDGQEIVFDLLGDIYLLPIEGGEAKVLSSGLAWDMQPTFSPDGSRIAFTSDRAGGDNLWVMERDGSNPQAISDESFRLLNSPAWDPSGSYLVGRKHYTARRSLGAGEIWLYHVGAGGDGLRLTDKPNDQKDVGEPAVSPDGRYVYYSRDATAGGTFQYNKDPNGQIYVIFRFDRETGETIPFVGGAGGAARPTPSPDGEKLAFVRRVRYKSVLFVKDLKSGEERPLFDGLDRDMQETWAIHGVYPRFAWTPDSQDLVFWADGGLHRLSTASGEVKEIPFQLTAEHTYIEPLRFANDPKPDDDRTRMLRWTQVSPQGDRVVYQSLGHLYVKELPDGTPRRLTQQNDHFEFYPRFSPDGRFVVYTTWNDQEFGSVRVVAAAGGSSRAITSEPGHYIEPVISPSGETVVYRKVEGGYLRSPLWSLDPGIYRTPITGGEAVKITDSGFAPHFGVDDERLFINRGGDESGTRLVSVTLDGHDEREHLSGKWTSRYRVAPNGRWVAFVDRFQAYVAPFVATGRSVSTDSGSGGLPVAQVSRDEGDTVHFSKDSSRVHWSQGSILHGRDLSELYAFLDDSPEELPEPPTPEQGIDLSFPIPDASATGVVALVGGRAITMLEEEVLEDSTIVVEDGVIVAVGPRESIEVPAGAKVVDVSGKTLLPGFIDAHWHGAFGTNEIIPQSSWNNYATLAFGVTTLHDPSNDTSTTFAAAEMARAGLIVAPRIFSTGTILYGAETEFTAKVESFDDALSHVRRMQDAGAISIKSYNQPRRDQRQQFVKAGHELKMLVMPEGGSLLQHNLTMVADGHTGVEHSVPAAKVYDDILQFWGASRTAYTPTLGIAYGGLWGENYWYAESDVWAHERLLRFVPRRLVDPVARRPVHAPHEEYNHFNSAAIAAGLAEVGVGVQIGAHGQREGLAAHWEIWMMVQGGMTPHRALRTATLDGAEYLGFENHLGSLQQGKLGDIIVLDENPLEDIQNTDSVAYVLLDGRLYDARSMDRLWPDPQPRPELYFEGADDLGASCSTGACDAPSYAVCNH